MKNLASFFLTSMPLIWESNADTYDTWNDALDTAKALGANISDNDEHTVLATFPDNSTCIINRDGAGVSEVVLNKAA